MPNLRIDFRASRLAVSLLLAILASWGGRAMLGRVGGDYIAFHAAAILLARGESPYDPASEARVQRGLEGVQAEQAPGLNKCLPYFYPPWLALACLPLLPLGFPTALVVWSVLIFWALLLAGLALGDTLTGVRRWMIAIVVVAFAPSVLAACMGQVAPLVLLGVAIVWNRLEAGRDRSAGLVMAWLTVKPQLTVVLLPGLILWAARRGRRDVIWGFMIGLGVLVSASFLSLPNWPVECLTAPSRAVRTTDVAPETGATWPLILRALGLHGPALWGLYAAAAVPAVALVARVGWDRTRPLGDLIALGFLAAFFVAPYGQIYDLLVLSVPSLILVGRLPEKVGTALIMVTMIGPWLNMILVYRSLTPPGALFWFPTLLAALWICDQVGRHPGGRSTRARLVRLS